MSEQVKELKEMIDKLIIAYYGELVDYDIARKNKKFLRFCRNAVID